jgi:hypothetical protein
MLTFNARLKLPLLWTRKVRLIPMDLLHRLLPPRPLALRTMGFSFLPVLVLLLLDLGCLAPQVRVEIGPALVQGDGVSEYTNEVSGICEWEFARDDTYTLIIRL